MALLLNWFKSEIHPLSLKVFVKNFATWEESTAALKTDEYKDMVIYRGRGVEQGCRLIAYCGRIPNNWEEKKLELAADHGFTSRIIKHSLRLHFRSMGLFTNEGQWGLRVIKGVNEVGQMGISLSHGINIKVHNSVEDGFGLVINWEVSAEFMNSLADPNLKHIAPNLGVIFKPTPGHQCDEKIKNFRNRYLGTVMGFGPNSGARVFCRDGEIRELPSEVLYLEAKPEAIKRFEALYPSGKEARVVWRRIQQLGHVLTKEGRRNPAVLRDRLGAIQQFLSPEGSQVLICRLASYDGGQVTVDLSPLMIKSGGGDV